eukprot:UN33126
MGENLNSFIVDDTPILQKIEGLVKNNDQANIRAFRELNLRSKSKKFLKNIYEKLLLMVPPNSWPVVDFDRYFGSVDVSFPITKGTGSLVREIEANLRNDPNTNVHKNNSFIV